MSKLFDIIKKFGASSYEIEMRFYATPDIIKRFLVENQSKFSKIAVITKTANMIYPVDESVNYIMTKENGVTSYCRKTRLISEKHSFVSVNLAKEENIQRYSPKKEDKKFSLKLKSGLRILRAVLSMK